MLEQLMYQVGMSVSSILGGLFSRGVDSAPHEKMVGHRDAQSYALCKSNGNNYKQNSPGTLVSWRHSLFQASHGLMLVGGGGV